MFGPTQLGPPTRTADRLARGRMAMARAPSLTALPLGIVRGTGGIHSHAGGTAGANRLRSSPGTSQARLRHVSGTSRARLGQVSGTMAGTSPERPLNVQQVR